MRSDVHRTRLMATSDRPLKGHGEQHTVIPAGKTLSYTRLYLQVTVTLFEHLGAERSSVNSSRTTGTSGVYEIMDKDV